MSDINRTSRQVAAPTRHGRADRYDEDEEEIIGWPEVTALLRRHQVTLLAVVLIIADLVWKYRFLHNFYFRQDDFHFTELALQYGLGWKYLTYVGSGHLHPGVLLIVWILAKTAPYNWGVASAITLAMVLVASVACWWMLRTLIGNRLALLIPLTLYLVTPLTFPDDSWWQSAIETLPLQAALFLSVTAHVHFVRSGRYRHAVAAAIWLAVGLFFFEKAVVIPVVLFAVTAGFLVDGSIGQSLRLSLVRYWRAWTAYLVIVAGYLALLLDTLQNSTVKPKPTSLSASLTFSWNLVRETLLPGLFGGPWRWFLAPDDAVAFAFPATALAWIAVMATCAIVIASIAVRGQSWRAWSILAAWIVLADIVPILLGRLATVGYAQLLALDTRYVADAAPVAALCIALVFWPVVQPSAEPGGDAPVRSRRRQREPFAGTTWRAVGVGLTGILVAGSIWSVNRYEDVTALQNYVGNVYLDNVRNALADVPPDTVIFDQTMKNLVMASIYYDTFTGTGSHRKLTSNYGYQSVALAPMESAKTKRDVRWTMTFDGTIDRLMFITQYGTLKFARIKGVSAVPPPRDSCAPARKGVATLSFSAPSSAGSGILRIGYLSGAPLAGQAVTVRYAGTSDRFVPAKGLHYAYFSVSGSAANVSVAASAGLGFCLGSATAGNLDLSWPPASAAG
jgi:hypothetical protein